MEKYFNDLIKSLRNRFNELMDIKIKKLSIKESLVKNLELFKNNYNLVESVAELKYNDVKFIKYNANLNWKNKLDIIFDYMDEPLYVKNKNICHRQNIGRPFNILQEIKKQSKEEMEKEKEKKEKEEKKEEIKKNKFLNELDQQTNYELPYFSINHDIIKDRNIILYDKGENVEIQKVSNYNKINKIKYIKFY